MDSSLSVPAAKRKKISKKILDSSDSSDEDDRVTSIAKGLPSSEPSAVWKIDRLKASLQKPASEPKDKQSPVEPRVQKPSTERNAVSEEQLKERKEKVRKEETSHAKEKTEKKLNLIAETVPKTPTRVEDRSQKDTSSKTTKHSEHAGLKPLEKGNKSDAKQRQTYVIPKLKKPAETASKTAPVVDTWSDMLRRGAELEKNRSMQMTPNSSGMRRIPKIPKTSLCGQADVGVLDKIEQHPGFLRWEQAASQRNARKTEDERNSVTAKSNDDKIPRQQTSTTGPDKEASSQPVILSEPEPAQPPTAVTPLIPQSSSSLHTPPSARKKALLPTPVSVSRGVAPSMSSCAIPVLVGRGKAGPSSPAIHDDTFVPDEPG